jgi:hypothetical protein
MSNKPELDPNLAPETGFLNGALQALAATACALLAAPGAAIGVPAGPPPSDELRVVAATGDSPAVGTILHPSQLPGPHRDWPLPGGDSAPAPGLLILFGPGDLAPANGPAWPWRARRLPRRATPPARRARRPGAPPPCGTAKNAPARWTR